MSTEKSLLTLRSEDSNPHKIKSSLINNNHVYADTNDEQIKTNMLLCAQVCNMIASMY